MSVKLDLCRRHSSFSMLSFAIAAFAATTARAADVERGAALYRDHGCYSCHGHQGKGTFAEQQTSLLPNPPVLAATAPFLANEETFRVYLRLRSEPTSAEPRVTMPHYPQHTLDDAAVGDLYAYIKTFPQEDPALDAIPTMRWILESSAAPRPAGERPD